ncbi:MAG: hypothetical protein ACK5LN_14780 [Propioniciclava sp.]
MTDLKTELTGSTGALVPPYQMLIPAGWQAFDLSLHDERAIVAQAVLRLRSNGRGDLAPHLTHQVGQALTTLRRQNGFAYAIAGETSPTWAIGSASLVGVRRDATPDLPLDTVVTDAITRHGGAPLGGDERFVRWTTRRTVTLEGEEVTTTTINYLTPVPGSRRTQALQWSATVTHAADVAAEDPVLETWNLLFDTHVASFTWLTPSVSP